MKNCLVLLMLCFVWSSYAQDYKFGKVSKEELEERFYPLDSTAEAAYLYSDRRTYYQFSENSGFQIVNEFHDRIKIYNKDGFKKATQLINFYKPEDGTNEKVTSLDAVTYNLIGGKVKKSKVSGREIFEEQLNQYTAQKKITFPEIQEGSVIELSYKLVSPYIQAIDPLKFQHDIPVKKMECTIEIPEYFKFKQRMKGYYLITPEESRSRRTISWTSRERGDGVRSSGNSSFENTKVDYQAFIQKYSAENIPALKDNEPYVNNANDYRGGVSFEINYIQYPNSSPKYFATSWEDVSKSMYSVMGPELEKDNYFKDDIASIVQGTDDTQKIVGLFQFIKQKIKWNGFYGVFPSNSLRKTYKEGVGNVADINLTLIAMLRSAGLDANPVLVSTRSNGTPLFPTRNGFDYLVAAVAFGDSYALLDASEPYSVPNMLPPRALNWQGRLIFKNGSSRWVDLGTGIKSEEDDFISVKISDDGMVEGMMRTKFSDLGALEYRNENNRIKEEELIARLEDKYSIEIENYRVSNKLDLGKDVTRTIKFSSEDLVEEINGKMYIRPLLFKGFSANPFKANERKFPIEFSSPWAEKSTVTIELPQGYSIESAPESKALGLPENMGLFKYQIVAEGNKVRVISSLEFNTAKIPANYYETLKGFFAEFVEKQSEKIVLVKS